MERPTIMFVGDASVGKTAILERLQDRQFSAEYSSTISAELVSLPYARVYDIPGTSRLLGESQTCGIPPCDAVVLFYDASDDRTLASIQGWHDEFFQSQDVTDSSPQVILVASKKDCAERALPLPSSVTAAIAPKEHLSVSAKSGDGIDELARVLTTVPSVANRTTATFWKVTPSMSLDCQASNITLSSSPRAAHAILAIVDTQTTLSSAITSADTWRSSMWHETGLVDPKDSVLSVAVLPFEELDTVVVEAFKQRGWRTIVTDPHWQSTNQLWADLAKLLASFRADLLMRRLVGSQRRLVACVEHKSGCSWTGLSSECGTHMQTCPFRLEACRFGCGKPLRHYEREGHEASCERRYQTCGACGDAISTSLELHRNDCAARQSVARINIGCPFTDLGCPESALRHGEISSHVGDNLVSHVIMSANTIITMRREQIDIQRTIQQQASVIDQQSKLLVELRARLDFAEEKMEKVEASTKEARLENKILWDEVDAMKP